LFENYSLEEENSRTEYRFGK